MGYVYLEPPKKYILTSEEIIDHLRKKVKVSDADAALFLKYAGEPQYFKKNEYLVKEHDEQIYFYLINEGCLMSYFLDNDNNKHVMQFGREMWWTGDLEAFFKGEPNQYNIKAMVASKVYCFSYENLEQLLLEAPCFERYFRILFQNALVSGQKRIIRNIANTAEERYIAFKETFPKLELIVPQKYIASFLGITPEFLSKIRKRI